MFYNLFKYELSKDTVLPTLAGFMVLKYISWVMTNIDNKTELKRNILFQQTQESEKKK